jgi:hypothetical protein
MKDRNMRAPCLGLLLLFATASGCADLDSGGFGENYNGFPWPWLLTKAPPQTRTDTTIQHPQYSSAGRFARQPADSAGSGSSTQSISAQAPPGQSPSGQTSAAQSPPENAPAEE